MERDSLSKKGLEQECEGTLNKKGHDVSLAELLERIPDVKILKEQYDISLLKAGCESLGISLSEEQINQFLTYYACLVEVNQVMNLTAITGYEEVVQKHFIDSLSVTKFIDLRGYSTVLDVGTGAGFPGVPLKIAFPHLRVVLLDSLNKRIQFLQQLTKKLCLCEISAVHGRAEELARNKEYRGQFELCVSRAVANLSSLSEYCLPFLIEKGRFIAYKSINIDTEVQNAKKAIHILGGKLEKWEELTLPGSDIGRSFVIIQKEHPTSAKYPRRAGLPSREPLGMNK